MKNFIGGSAVALLIGSISITGVESATCIPLNREPKFKNIIKEIQRPILESFETSFPYWQLSGGSDLFRTNFDYHSSVHAHWALLSMARIFHDETLRLRVLSRFTEEALLNEYNFLADPLYYSYERPYGRAWLLILLKELTFHPEFRSRRVAQHLRVLLEGQLVEYLQAAQYPDRPNAGFRGDNYSNLFIYWAFKESGVLTPAARQLLNNFQIRMAPYLQDLENSPRNVYDFFDPRMVWDIFQPVSTPLEEFMTLNYPTSLAGSGTNSHISGFFASNFWPLARAASHENVASFNEACHIFKQKFFELYESRESWGFDFMGARHWVPQWMWVAILYSINGELEKVVDRSQ